MQQLLLYNTVGNSLRLTSKNSMAVILGLAWVTSITTVFNCAFIYFLKIEHDNQNWIQGYGEIIDIFTLIWDKRSAVHGCSLRRDTAVSRAFI